MNPGVIADDAAPRLRLRPPTHQVDPRAVTWWRLQDAGSWVVVLLGGGVVLLFVHPLWLVLLGVAATVVAVTDVTVTPRIRYDRHRWEVTDQAVYVRNGVFVEDWRVAPLSRVQTVDTQRGPLQQWLGLSTVTVTTASTAGALRIKGLDRHKAADLVEALTAATEATAGDAT
ncbi:MAG: PH domain-containing protein [Pseudonocardia sp.]